LLYTQVLLVPADRVPSKVEKTVPANPKFTVPAPPVRSITALVKIVFLAFNDTAPLKLIVPVVSVIFDTAAAVFDWVFNVVVPPMVSVPAPTLNALVVLVAGMGIENAPVQLSELVPLMDTVLAELLAPVMVKEAQEAAVLIVIILPTFIVTASDDVGVAADPAAPPAVVAQIGSVQFPLSIANRCAETPIENTKMAITASVNFKTGWVPRRKFTGTKPVFFWCTFILNKLGDRLEYKVPSVSAEFLTHIRQ
jgi:hypothetical protein